MNRPSRLNGVVDNLMVSLGLGKSFHGWKVVGEWSEIVGPDIARVARAIRYGNGVLTVVVQQDTWRQELEMQREELLRKIWMRPGGRAIEKIVLRAGSLKETDDGDRPG